MDHRSYCGQTVVCETNKSLRYMAWKAARNQMKKKIDSDKKNCANCAKIDVGFSMQLAPLKLFFVFFVFLLSHFICFESLLWFFVRFRIISLVGVTRIDGRVANIHTALPYQTHARKNRARTHYSQRRKLNTSYLSECVCAHLTADSIEILSFSHSS